jgi:hypothetical protein
MIPSNHHFESEPQPRIIDPGSTRQQPMERGSELKQRFSKSRNGMSVLSCFLPNKVTLRSSLMQYLANNGMARMRDL